MDQAGIGSAETTLGFRLPPLLASVYRRIGDGGFGPDYRLLRLSGDGSDETVVGGYVARRAAGEAGTGWPWPRAVLPILHWGCGMYACVDCASDLATVLLFEPNPGVPKHAWYLDSPTLADWFTHYVEDTGWWTLAEDGEDFDLPPWPQWTTRV